MIVLFVPHAAGDRSTSAGPPSSFVAGRPLGPSRARHRIGVRRTKGERPVATQPNNKAVAAPPSYLHPAEVADLLHVSPKTVSCWAKEGRLPFLKTPVATAATPKPRSASWPTSSRCRRRPQRRAGRILSLLADPGRLATCRLLAPFPVLVIAAAQRRRSGDKTLDPVQPSAGHGHARPTLQRRGTRARPDAGQRPCRSAAARGARPRHYRHVSQPEREAMPTDFYVAVATVCFTLLGLATTTVAATPPPRG